ncbi:MAG: hypothetical protein COA44_13880 [Arcobacter sp.]|nr:MAG: hypothetical protein COA44_13880 [Arcobacter sp.]
MISIQAEIDLLHNELELFDDVMDKYEYIIELGKQLLPLQDKYKTMLFKVQGCQSQIWLHPYVEEGKIYFEAGGDALIAKGLVDILIRIYSGHSAKEILETDTAELKELHLSEIISSGRQNGIASMIKRIYAFAKETSASQTTTASFTEETSASQTATASFAKETSASQTATASFDEELIRKKIISGLEQIYDPEIPVNIYTLGLIYKIDIILFKEKVCCYIEMTLTSPACPVAESLVEQVYNVSYLIEEIDEMNVELVFEPPWSPDKIPYEAKLELGLL